MRENACFREKRGKIEGGKNRKAEDRETDG